MKYIILNFAYGFGPFLRTTELALAVNDLLEEKTGTRFGIIVPWVYGEKQKKIMIEEFGKIIAERSEEILLDETLGGYLKSVFYGEKSYEESLKFHLENYKKIQKKIDEYFKENLKVETFSGKKIILARREIALTITRAPRINFPVKPAYLASFAYISEILERGLAVKEITAGKKLFEKMIPIYKKIEAGHDLHFIAEPSTFSYLQDRRPRFKTEILTPPNAALPARTEYQGLKQGIYVTITGIPGQERLFQEARQIGLKLYANQPEKIAGSEKALPNIIYSSEILLHFARSGWGSVWLSLFTGVPLIAPDYDKNDDPEIYFNNLCLEKIGLGKIYRGQPLEELLDFKAEYRKNVKKMNQYLMDKYKTTDGVKYTAEKIINDYLKI
ncbi:MAG: hypothetical protein PHS62_00420 [Patescibacteria group bacterium]|nr:hypothetical protein [Patescibacteria group bacterium]